MMLDEAIKHCEDVMMENLEKTKDRNASDPIAISCGECADNHRQLAEWLKDYKRLLCAVDAIKAEIETYENDCMLSCPNNDDCRDCNETTFKSIYNIIEKHTEGVRNDD